MKKSYYNIAIILLSILFLNGCATTEMQTKTKMANTIFLSPQEKTVEKSIFIDIKNTSGQNIAGFDQQLRSKLEAKGYKLVDSPKKATYILQTNILFANNLREAQALQASVSGGVAGGILGLAGAGGNASGNNALAGVVIGALGAGLIGKFTEDDIFQLITDVRVNETISSQSKEYNTRIYSQAVKMGLKADEAMPAMVSNVTAQISNIF